MDAIAVGGDHEAEHMASQSVHTWRWRNGSIEADLPIANVDVQPPRSTASTDPRAARDMMRRYWNPKTLNSNGPASVTPRGIDSVIQCSPARCLLSITICPTCRP